VHLSKCAVVARYISNVLNLAMTRNVRHFPPLTAATFKLLNLSRMALKDFLLLGMKPYRTLTKQAKNRKKGQGTQCTFAMSRDVFRDRILAISWTVLPGSHYFTRKSNVILAA
jgi:hypothetical protein